MSDMSDYLENASYDFWFRPNAAAPVRPTLHRISLWSAITNAEAGVGTELDGATTAPGYARFTVSFAPPLGGSGSNDVPAITPIATSNWPAATHYGVHDHLGNLLQSLKPLSQPVAVLAGNAGRWEPGDLQLTFL